MTLRGLIPQSSLPGKRPRPGGYPRSCCPPPLRGGLLSQQPRGNRVPLPGRPGLRPRVNVVHLPRPPGMWLRGIRGPLPWTISTLPWRLLGSVNPAYSTEEEDSSSSSDSEEESEAEQEEEYCSDPQNEDSVPEVVEREQVTSPTPHIASTAGSKLQPLNDGLPSWPSRPLRAGLVSLGARLIPAGLYAALTVRQRQLWALRTPTGCTTSVWG